MEKFAARGFAADCKCFSFCRGRKQSIFYNRGPDVTAVINCRKPPGAESKPSVTRDHVFLPILADNITVRSWSRSDKRTGGAEHLGRQSKRRESIGACANFIVRITKTLWTRDRICPLWRYWSEKIFIPSAILYVFDGIVKYCVQILYLCSIFNISKQS